MRRVVADTNVYVDWINRGRHEDVLFARETVRYLSAVVLMELRAGASSPADRRLLEGLQRAFERAGRVLTPSRRVFAEAGDTLARLRSERSFGVTASRSIANDVLIALSARSIGATLVTQNRRDYEAIQAVRPFRLAIVSAHRPEQR
jgi:predicted nucleic acid-binding protein